MNKENNKQPFSDNAQVHSHQEGQQQNISGTSGRTNNSQEVQDMQQPREGMGDQSETESERANRNEDEGIRGGNSSI